MIYIGVEELFCAGLSSRASLGTGSGIPPSLLELKGGVVDMAKRVVRAPRGSALTCKGWEQEAAMRMLMNNLDPDVAEKPEERVYDWYRKSNNSGRPDAIVRTLKALECDETLLVQSGKPVESSRPMKWRKECLKLSFAGSA